MSMVYWGIVAGVISMVVLLFFCIAVMPAAKDQTGRRGDAAMAEDHLTGGETAVPGSRHAA
jgi:hypothetical protein